MEELKSVVSCLPTPKPVSPDVRAEDMSEPLHSLENGNVRPVPKKIAYCIDVASFFFCCFLGGGGGGRA